jgi:Zn-dependent peptidase ImmA (M78 family)
VIRVDVKPELLRWARERARLNIEDLAARFPQLDAWEASSSRPTLKQLESFAKATHTPIGFLFLSEPPVERIPIPDFRTIRDERIKRPSPDLLETIYVCQQRQEWYRDHARSIGAEPLEFVESTKTSDEIEATAASIRHRLGFDLAERRALPTWTEALRRFIEQADDLGVLVMVSGVVLNNNRRRLDADEFRGFALSDDLAPLVFINGADTKAAQMFTLAHELAHLWLGQTALTDANVADIPDAAVERWCDRVAAELLVPLAAFREEYRRDAELESESNRLARMFKVSTLVVLRRMHDARGLTKDRFWTAFRSELDRLRAIPRTTGGDFYLTQAVRLSRRFARALITSTFEGQTLHRDAFRLLGFSKLETLHELGRSLEVLA